MILEVILEAMFSNVFFIHYIIFNQWGSEGRLDSTFLAPQIQEKNLGSWDTVKRFKNPKQPPGMYKESRRK